MNESKSNSVPEVPDTLNEVAQSLQETVFGVWADFVSHIPYLIAGMLVLFFTWVITSLLEHFASRILSRWKRRQSIRDLITRLLVITAWVLGLLLAAMIVFPGLTPARALGGLGLLSVAVGLAFRDIFENFFAGILILWRFPFENGDFIECQGLLGSVEDVTVRMTRIRKTSGELVVVPNSFLFKNPVEVLTNQSKRRVTIIAGIAYGEQVDEAVEVIEQAVKTCGTVDKERSIQIFPQTFGASSIDIEVSWWTDPKPVDIRRSRGEVVSAVKRALDDADIEIPFPYRTLTFKQPLAVENHSPQAETNT